MNFRTELINYLNDEYYKNEIKKIYQNLIVDS